MLTHIMYCVHQQPLCTVLNIVNEPKSAEKLTLCDLTFAFWQDRINTSTSLGFCEVINTRKVHVIIFDARKTF